MIFADCHMGAHIKPEGWHNWGKPEREETTTPLGCHGFPVYLRNRSPAANQLKYRPCSHKYQNHYRTYQPFFLFPNIHNRSCLFLPHLPFINVPAVVTAQAPQRGMENVTYGYTQALEDYAKSGRREGTDRLTLSARDAFSKKPWPS